MQRPPVVVHPRPGQGGHVELPRRPEPIRDHGRIMDPHRDHHEIEHPGRFGDGRPVTQRPQTHGPDHNQSRVFDNDRFRGERERHEREEHERGRYYWHEHDGNRYCHHYDQWGYHWYGWYMGDVYFWTRYWNDMYWYYDPYYGRWVYMRNGRWWYQDPARVEIVYIYTPETNTYYQYDNAPGGGAVLTPDPTVPTTTPPPAEPTQPGQPAPEAPAKIYYSGDGRRSVQVFGASNDAFLYDTAETPAFNPVFLASGVTEARFSQSAADQPLQVLLLTETKNDDGTTAKSFLMFDENGNSTMAAPTPAPVTPPDSTDAPAQPPTMSSTLNLLRSGFHF